jgi:phage tail sheath protein FI
MPLTLTYPGVYVQELPSSVHTIVGVPTAVAAFVGRARRGPLNVPVRIGSFAQFERAFGALWQQSELGYCVKQYFDNGGNDAVVVRTVTAADLATFTGVPPTIAVATNGAGPPLTLQARSPGLWFGPSSFRADVDWNTRRVGTPPNPDATVFNLKLTLTEIDPISGATSTTVESYQNLSYDPTAPTYVGDVLANDSRFVFAANSRNPADPNFLTPASRADVLGTPYTTVSALSDGSPLAWTDITGDPAAKTGMFALADADIFTMIMIPPPSPDENAARINDLLNSAAWGAIAAFAASRHAVAYIDPPAPPTWGDEPAVYSAVSALGNALDPVRFDNTALYYPWIWYADPLNGGRPRLFPPSASAMGVAARIDGTRGVWKAPAGEEAKLVGAQQLAYRMTDSENGELNPLAINCLRTFPIIGSVVWGARTLVGADSEGSQWKYLPVRRTAYFIEETLYRALGWVVFEPNDEPLWSQIRLNVGAFMRSLFRQGAFQGATPAQAYFVRCNSDTTTALDQDLGIVNVVVGFAPLKPAEFVVIKITQIAGQIQT